ncbi:isoamylase early set domain-containing protein [Antarcticibacterium sp. 1MA-6-2]|uniref:isoamylase early set domain-containing protein n=1 Tax=Antarcticibacterium sp. 1MA-6-2 TaxID=2908210 RepID=UPI001F321452|nr:isoamylase early set domain-containing protein [Antarcticibacterium sp. 1MA-6-2]UJH90402.1 isoamylase early set domain-containing protein [Antarcticibacterium sp. 1MA-6-2]
MAITKQNLKSKPVCKVTFTVPAKDAESVSVVGDFNEWDPKKTVLKKSKAGIFKGTVSVPAKNTYEFKYLIDGNYVNEPEADSQKWNDFACAENSVLEV